MPSIDQTPIMSTPLAVRVDNIISTPPRDSSRPHYPDAPLKPFPFRAHTRSQMHRHEPTRRRLFDSTNSNITADGYPIMPK